MEIKDITGIYNIGAKRFIVDGEYDECESVYQWNFNEIDENNKPIKGVSGIFYTDNIPFMSEVFDKIKEGSRG